MPGIGGAVDGWLAGGAGDEGGRDMRRQTIGGACGLPAAQRRVRTQRRSERAFGSAAEVPAVRAIGRCGRASHLQRSVLQSAALDVADRSDPKESDSDKCRNAARWTGEHNEMWRRGIITVIAAGLLSACGEEKQNPETHEGWEVGDCVTRSKRDVPTRATFRLDMLSTIGGDPPRLSLCRH